MHTRYFQVGGVIEDIPRGWAEKVREFSDDHAGARRPVRRPARPQRDRPAAPARTSARSTSETLLALGVTGPLLRAAGNPWDLRKATPYCSYDDFDFKIPVGTVGDNYDRFRVRLAEIDESVQDHRAGARRPARGPVHHRRPQDRAAAAPRARDLDGGADPPLQARHRGLPRPAGRGLLPDRVRRAASSAASCAPTARPSPRACTCATPRFVNLQATAPMVEDAYIADLIATLAMLDPILGRHRPVSPIRRRSATSPLRARLARPRLGRRRRPRQGPGRRSPTPPRRRCPHELRAEIEAAMARYPDRRSAAIPALPPPSAVHGWCSPEAIEQVAGVMRLTPGYLTRGRDLLRHVRDRAGRPPHASTSARTSPARCAAPTSCYARDARGRRAATSDVQRARASSASAPATSRRWPRSTASTSARSSSTDVDDRARWRRRDVCREACARAASTRRGDRACAAGGRGPTADAPRARRRRAPTRR